MPGDRLDEIIDRLRSEHTDGSWGFNVVGAAHWVITHAHIDLQAVVDEVLGAEAPDGAPGHPAWR